MPYTPPAYNAVTFNFVGSYAAPTGTTVVFNFGGSSGGTAAVASRRRLTRLQRKVIFKPKPVPPARRTVRVTGTLNAGTPTAPVMPTPPRISRVKRAAIFKVRVADYRARLRGGSGLGAINLAPMFVSWSGAEVGRDGGGEFRSSWTGIETGYITNDPSIARALFSWSGAEVGRDGGGEMRSSWSGVEVARSIEPAGPVYFLIT